MKRIEKDIREIRDALLEKEPPKFSEKDLVLSFFGAFVVGMTFAFKGIVIDVSNSLTAYHMFLIVFATITLLLLEIYFVAYSRVKKKSKRKLGQFLLKRIITFVSVTLIVAFIITLLYNFDSLLGGPMAVFRFIVAISLPTALGASISDLFERYKF